MRNIYMLLGLFLCLSIAFYSLKVSLGVQAQINANLVSGRYEATLQTDEQSASQYAKETVVFEGLTDEQMARRALASLCEQIKCAQTSDYAYSFQRDGIGAAGAFWYQPSDPSKMDRSRNDEHFLCRFRNEGWVICNVSYNTGVPGIDVYARTIGETRMTELDGIMTLQKRFPRDTKSDLTK